MKPIKSFIWYCCKPNARDVPRIPYIMESIGHQGQRLGLECN